MELLNRFFQLKSSPFYKQPDAKECGLTCLRIIGKHYGKLISLEEIREISDTTREGSSLLKLSDAAEDMGFKTIGTKWILLHLTNRINISLVSDF